MSLDEKQSLVNHLLAEIETKINRLTEQIESLQESRNSESKSTAGDKHEVGRAMAQTELDNLSKRLSELKERLSTIKQIDLGPAREVRAGSLVTTATAKYFLSVGAGKVKLGSSEYLAVSPASPIGQVMLGKKEGDSVLFRDKPMEIKTIS